MALKGSSAYVTIYDSSRGEGGPSQVKLVTPSRYERCCQHKCSLLERSTTLACAILSIVVAVVFFTSAGGGDPELQVSFYILGGVCVGLGVLAVVRFVWLMYFSNPSLPDYIVLH
jgi:hypothetical protein